jgi:hypothetical protein
MNEEKMNFFAEKLKRFFDKGIKQSFLQDNV